MAWGGTWVVLTVRDFERTTDPPGAYSTWNQATPESGGLSHHLTLTFYVASSPAAAHAQVQVHRVPPEPVVVRGTAADEVYERTTSGPVGTFTHASWRKGRYWGKILLSGPGLAGDLGDLRELLVLFMKRVP
jgi:hypothetical protein